METIILTTLISAVVGAFLGSSGKVLDFFLAKRANRLEIRKLYYTRKLEVLQAYVSTCSQVCVSCFHNAVAFRQMKSFNFFGEEGPSRSAVMQNLTLQMERSQKMMEELAGLSSAADMYVDLNMNQNHAFVLVGATHAASADIDDYMNDIWNVIDAHDLDVTFDFSGPAGKEYNAKLAEFQNHLELIAQSYDVLANKVNVCIKLVRDDVKKFEL